MILAIALLLAQAAEPSGLRLQDEGVAKGTVDTLNCVGAGVSCTRAGRKGTLTVSGGGGSASAGGSTGQVQWNNATVLDGTARVTTDGNDLMLSGQTSVPTGAAGKLTPLAYGLFGPAMAAWVNGDLGFSWGALTDTADATKGYWTCTTMGFGATLVSNAGHPGTISLTGISGAVAWASTDAKTRSRWMSQPTGGSINASGAIQNTAPNMWRGNASGLGGFRVHGQTAVGGTPPAGQRLFFGLTSRTSAPSASADPSTIVNQVGFQCDATQTTLRIGSADATTFSSADLGANFPCTTTGVGYDWWLWATPNASSINYAIREIVGGFTASGTLSSNLPVNTVQLGWLQWINTGPTTASAASLHAGSVCVVANP